MATRIKVKLGELVAIDPSIYTLAAVPFAEMPHANYI